MSKTRDKLIKKWVASHDPFGSIGKLTPAQRIKRGNSGRIEEDDPRWNQRTMGNRRGREKGFVRDYR